MKFLSQHDLGLVALCLLPALVTAVALVRLAITGARPDRGAPQPEPGMVPAATPEPVPETGEIIRA